MAGIEMAVAVAVDKYLDYLKKLFQAQAQLRFACKLGNTQLIEQAERSAKYFFKELTACKVSASYYYERLAA